MPRVKSINWAEVEADYRAGIKSDRQIARERGCSHTAIQKRAKAEKWARDLTVRIRAKTQEKLANSALVATRVARKSKGGTLATDNEIVDASSDVQFKVVRGHQIRAARLRFHFDQLDVELEASVVGISREKLVGMAVELAAFEGDTEGKTTKLKELFALLSSLPTTAGRIVSLKAMGEILKTIAAIERQAYSIDEDVAPESAVIASLKRIRGIAE